MQLISLNVGLPQEHRYGPRKIAQTGGYKTPVPEAYLHWTNLDGDRQADLENHGGPDKAVCVYSFDHYPYWEEWSGRKLNPGTFSENFTISGIRETEVCIGDTYKVGEVLVQVSQPRTPCYKLQGKFERSGVQKTIAENGYSGFYFRVLSEGWVRMGDKVELIHRHPAGVTIDFANDVLYRFREDSESLLRLLAVPELSAAWRDSFSQRI